MSKATKGISDPVHGTIQLNEVEARVISTRAFQRLRNVKQLGLAHMVFPSADYSRFSHSLGVCHVTQRIIDALKASGVRFDSDPAEEQKYRLAGLLHDVGHYPYSHAMEDAIQDHYSGLMTEEVGDGRERRDSGGPADLHETRWLDHESVGKSVLEENEELNDVLVSAGFDPADVYRVFARASPPRFANLISSDMDADRIDYLLRTAHHTGLPYGAVDLDYLLSQLRVDGSQHICVHPKALRTADHFLLGRYFDYQQVAFHKTVVALEWVLKDVIRALLREGWLSCSASEVKAWIASDKWESFDDTYMLHLIRDLAQKTSDQSTKLKAESILLRRPPKLVGQIEYLDERGNPAEKILLHKRVVMNEVERWAEQFRIPRNLWHVWDRGLTFTKVGSSLPISALTEDGKVIGADPDKGEQAIHVLDERTNTSTPIMNMNRSLMFLLADRALYSLRVYVLLPPDRQGDRPKIAKQIREDMRDIRWQ